MGRPRSTRAHNDVLDAAAALFAERGIEGTSMDAISQESGVSKATIYKHWRDKDALALEAMLRVHGRDETPDIASGDLRADLIAVLAHKPPARYGALRERVTPHLLAYCARNVEFASQWRARVLQPARTQMQDVLLRGITRGELPPDLDTDLATALLIGPTMYSWMMKFIQNKPLFVPPATIVDMFLKTYGLEDRRPAPAPAPAATPKTRRATRRAARRPDPHASRAARG
jgi:AcrR family transcriptional regulator